MGYRGEDGRGRRLQLIVSFLHSSDFSFFNFISRKSIAISFIQRFCNDIFCERTTSIARCAVMRASDCDVF